jgi:hypothetical protein
MDGPVLHEWKNIEEKTIVPGFRARFIHSANMTFALWDIDAGASLPEHAHPHEQVVHLLEGELSLTVAGINKVMKQAASRLFHQTLGTLGRPSPYAMFWMSSTRCVKTIFRTACRWFFKTPKAFEGEWLVQNGGHLQGPPFCSTFKTLFRPSFPHRPRR